MNMERFGVFAKDPTIKIWTMCDANTFLTNTVIETYESLYIKIHEMINVLLAKGASDVNLSLVVPPYMTEKIPYNSIDVGGRQFVGWCGQNWRVYHDPKMPKDQLEIESDIGKAVLVVLNFPEKVGEK